MATIRDFGIPGVGPGILQPKLKNRWRVLFTKLGGPGNPNSNDVSIQAVSVKRPQLQFSEVSLYRYNSRAWIAGKHEWQPTEIVVEDDVTSNATYMIQQQVTTQQQLIGSTGPWLAAAPEGSLYKFATTIDMLDGNTEVLETWELEGCWFADVAYGDLTYKDQTDAVSITLKVRFDHARQIVRNYTSGFGSALGGDGGGEGGGAAGVAVGITGSI